MTGYVMVLGLPSEPPVSAVARALHALGIPHVVLNQRQLVRGAVQSWYQGGVAGGVIDMAGVRYPLDSVVGIYTRLTSWTDLPEVAAESALIPAAQQIGHALEAWLETTGCCVINRTSANDSNNSKPYQAMIIRDHFDVPATLVTTDPAEALAFRRAFERVIYKSVSGMRSIVTELSGGEMERLPLLANAPVQFQEYVSGVDVRVHVVGTELFATSVESDAVDYRYDRTGQVQMAAVDLPESIARECVALTRRLGLELSGIDLRFADDGRVVCFEVNPSPAYIVYEDETGQPISAAIARHLAGVRSSLDMRWGL